jgi:hypothetical protein
MKMQTSKRKCETINVVGQHKPTIFISKIRSDLNSSSRCIIGLNGREWRSGVDGRIRQQLQQRVDFFHPSIFAMLGNIMCFVVMEKAELE